jgi:hypothetical protein
MTRARRFSSACTEARGGRPGAQLRRPDDLHLPPPCFEQRHCIESVQTPLSLADRFNHACELPIRLAIGSMQIRSCCGYCATDFCLTLD